MTTLEVAALVWMAGFVIGLGAVTVIEVIGFLGQRSGYWTEATIRTHKVTKPLIWLGLLIAALGGAWHYSIVGASVLMIFHTAILPVMLVNGSFLSFWISPRLLERERKGQAQVILPKAWRTAITLSFGVSILTWWGALVGAVLAIT